MRNNKRLANLIFELEYIIGSECYNPNSYDGYTGEEGKEFRYPIGRYNIIKIIKEVILWKILMIL